MSQSNYVFWTIFVMLKVQTFTTNLTNWIITLERTELVQGEMERGRKKKTLLIDDGLGGRDYAENFGYSDTDYSDNRLQWQFL